MKTVDFGRIDTLRKAITAVCNRGAGKWNKSKEKRGILNFPEANANFAGILLVFVKNIDNSGVLSYY